MALNQANFSKGDRVSITTAKHGVVIGKFSHITPAGVGYIHGDNGQSYERVLDKIIKLSNATSDFKVSGGSNLPQTIVIDTKFDINKRFGFLESLIRMVVSKKRVSLIITGEGGLGKTYTVRKELERCGLDEKSDYIFVKGFSTAKGLYNTLYENQEKLIIFDDCDEVLTNDIAKNILKGALDSYDKRTINWISQSFTSDVPAEFEFKGQVIFISNMSKNKIDQAILSRASNVDLTMSIEDKLARMEAILPAKTFMPQATLEEKQDGLNFLKKNKDNCRNLNMRTLIEIVDFRTSGEEGWEELAEYVIHSS